MQYIKSVFLALFLTVPVCTVHGQSVRYLAKHLALANELSAKFGIPAPVILSIAMVESACGTGDVAKRLHNHFGIVGKNNMTAANGKHKSRFKQYETERDSYTDFCRLIAQKKFYALLQFNADYEAWVSAISATGYATQPIAWKNKVLKTIQDNKL